MFGAVGHQRLVVAPGEAVEELFERSGLFDPCIVAEGLVEDFDHLSVNLHLCLRLPTQLSARLASRLFLTGLSGG